MIALLVAIFALQVALGAMWLLSQRRSAIDLQPLLSRLENLEKLSDRAERGLRDELTHARREASQDARVAREELAVSLRANGETQQSQLLEVGDRQLDQLTVFSDRLERLRGAIEQRFDELTRKNEEKLDQVRATVDEKLQGTLEKRLGESFRQVSDRLEQVHKGLGEMQNLAIGVGDLKRVLTNVKTRGGWGEVQLGALLDQVLTPEQYARNVKTKDGSDEIVEFAIVLPGRTGVAGDVVYLPIDAKFPTEDYQRLVDALEAADPVAAEAATRQLATRIKGCAKDIFTKYHNPPKTTDFAVLFLPTEGLYAEVVRNTQLVESVQRDYRVIIAGPSNLAALLNSLQMGFRTLAVQQRSSEVWNLLGAVKTEFGRFGAVLEGVRKKLDVAARTMDEAGRRSRAIERRLATVSELPTTESKLLLADVLGDGSLGDGDGEGDVGPS